MQIYKSPQYKPYKICGIYEKRERTEEKRGITPCIGNVGVCGNSIIRSRI